jgi:uncharacterized protein YndB with AHSA1/START domain
MTQASPSAGSMRVSRMIKAPRKKVYQAFLDPQAVATWLAPDNMRGRVHTFDPREGGQFRLSLTYQNPDDSQRGKTSDDTDTFHGRFVKLVPDEKIVEAIEFESRESGFAGEMTMTVLLAEVDGGTEVTLLYENVPKGIRPEDNEAGSRQSLQKLAALVE